MTLYTDVVSKVKRMSQAEKLALMKLIADSLSQDNLKVKRKHTLKSLYGSLRSRDGSIPSDEQIKN